MLLFRVLDTLMAQGVFLLLIVYVSVAPNKRPALAKATLVLLAALFRLVPYFLLLIYLFYKIREAFTLRALLKSASSSPASNQDNAETHKASAHELHPFGLRVRPNPLDQAPSAGGDISHGEAPLASSMGVSAPSPPKEGSNASLHNVLSSPSSLVEQLKRSLSHPWSADPLASAANPQTSVLSQVPLPHAPSLHTAASPTPHVTPSPTPPTSAIDVPSSISTTRLREHEPLPEAGEAQTPDTLAASLDSRLPASPRMAAPLLEDVDDRKSFGGSSYDDLSVAKSSSASSSFESFSSPPNTGGLSASPFPTSPKTEVVSPTGLSPRDFSSSSAVAAVAVDVDSESVALPAPEVVPLVETPRTPRVASSQSRHSAVSSPEVLDFSEEDNEFVVVDSSMLSE